MFFNFLVFCLFAISNSYATMPSKRTKISEEYVNPISCSKISPSIKSSECIMSCRFYKEQTMNSNQTQEIVFAVLKVREKSGKITSYDINPDGTQFETNIKLFNITRDQGIKLYYKIRSMCPLAQNPV